jgi:hypothetical protein
MKVIRVGVSQRSRRIHGSNTIAIGSMTSTVHQKSRRLSPWCARSARFVAMSNLVVARVRGLPGRRNATNPPLAARPVTGGWRR